jgi:tetratricopeptide (TPR) repeat protein
MSSLLRFALPLLLLGALAMPAVAADDPEPPAYFVEHLMPSSDDVPEGWKLLDDASPGSGKMTEDDIAGIASGLGIEDEFYVDYRVFKRAGEKVPVAMCDVEKKVGAFHTALTEKAATNDWRVRELGSPTRILIVGGASPGARKLAEALVEHCVYALTEIAMNRIRGRSGQQEAGREAALAYTKAIDALAPKAGTARAVVGCIHWIKSQPERGVKDAKPDRAEQEKAVEHFAASIKDGVPYPPKGSILVFVAGQLGGTLLTWKDKSRLDEALRALELAVENEKDAKRQGQRFDNRYNLCCAYARKGRKDEAFKYLRGALEVGKTLPLPMFRQSYKHIREKDEDMSTLRPDPRFTNLMKEFKPEEPKKPNRRQLPDGHPPVKPGDDGDDDSGK